MRIAHIVVQATILALLAACGGGGGNGGPGPRPPEPPVDRDGSWLTFNPSPVQASVFQGESAEITVTATATRQFSKPFNIAILDANGVILPNATFTASGGTQYQARLGTSTALKAGTHLTTLQVRVCEDNPAVCQQPFPGSPWSLPLGVNVKLRDDIETRVALTPNPAQPVADVDASATFMIEGAVAADLVGKANFAFVDRQGFLESPVSTSMPTPATVRGIFRTKAVRTPGTYPHVLELRACHDAIETCNDPVAGSPFLVAVTLKVNPLTNLVPLQPVPGLLPWSTNRGNAARTGYVPASFDATKFNRRWSFGANAYLDTSSLALDNGKVFATRRGFDTAELVAIDEASGAVSWRAPLGMPGTSPPPATGNGRVFAFSAGKLLVLDQASGAVQTQSEAYFSALPAAPVVHEGSLFVMDSRGLTKYNAPDYARAWNLATPDYPRWNASVNDSGFYLFVDGVLHAGRADTGEKLFSISGPDLTLKSAMTPVLSNTGMAFVQLHAKLVAFNLATRTIAWTQDTNAAGIPAYANGVVYTVVNGALVAYAADSGVLLWTSEHLSVPLRSTTPMTYPHVVVTNNLAFVSSHYGTSAIDLSTKRAVWWVPEVGDLSISQNGILYILAESGAISAINLR